MWRGAQVETFTRRDELARAVAEALGVPVEEEEPGFGARAARKRGAAGRGELLTRGGGAQEKGLTVGGVGWSGYAYRFMYSTICERVLVRAARPSRASASGRWLTWGGGGSSL